MLKLADEVKTRLGVLEKRHHNMSHAQTRAVKKQVAVDGCHFTTENYYHRSYECAPYSAYFESSANDPNNTSVGKQIYAVKNRT